MLCLAGVTGCAGLSSSPKMKETGAAAKFASTLPDIWFKEMVRHIYRWHFDESFILAPDRSRGLEIWIRPLSRELDEGDESQYGEVWIPGVKMLVEIKKADYRIPEMNLAIKDDQFKVQTVQRLPQPPAPAREYEVRRFERRAMLDYLFQTRHDRLRPSQAFRERLGRVFLDFMGETLPEEVTEDQIFYAAPISPVSNDLWVFWENRRLLLQYSSDMDLANPGFWEHTALNLEVVDLEKDVVTSYEETPGSNAYVTKDWVGRALYNCLVLGEKRLVPMEQANQKLRAR